MSVIIKNTDETWHMADVIHVINRANSPKIPLFFQVIYVDNHVSNWVKADLVTHIVPRLWIVAILGGAVGLRWVRARAKRP
jgi:hypothetical protein